MGHGPGADIQEPRNEIANVNCEKAVRLGRVLTACLSHLITISGHPRDAVLVRQFPIISSEPIRWHAIIIGPTGRKPANLLLVSSRALTQENLEVSAEIEQLASSPVASQRVPVAVEHQLKMFLQLTRAGRLPEAAALTERLLVTSPEYQSIAAKWLAHLGSCHKRLGNLTTALDFYFRALGLNEELGKVAHQAANLSSLGVCHRQLGYVSKAIEFHENALAIQESTNKLEGQAIELGNLGCCYEMLGQVELALELHRRALLIEETLGRLDRQADQLECIALCHQSMGNLAKAIEVHQRALKMQEQLESLQGQAIVLGNLGLCHRLLGDIPAAIALLERSMAIDTKTADLEGQASNLCNLGICHQLLGRTAEAIEMHRRALIFAEQLQIMECQALALANLGICHRALEDLTRAQSCLTRSLAVYEKMGLPIEHPDVGYFRRVLDEVMLPNQQTVTVENWQSKVILP